jgi:succinoglycan biosynthesis transport protein ExoP
MSPRDDSDSYLREDSYDAQAAYRPAVSTSDVLFALRRSWLYPVLGCLIGLTLAAFYISTVPSLYQSTATILVDRSVHRYLQTNKIITDPILDQMELASQIHILTSESIVVPVVRSLNLIDDREFVGPSNATGGSWSIGNILRAFTGGNGETSSSAASNDAGLERVAVDVFLKRLTVYRADVANVITVTFASEDAKKAASLANAIADTYVAANQEARTTSLKVANQLLQERLVELKDQALEADQALQNYKVANNLVTSGEKGLPVFDQLMSELLNVTGELTRTRLASAEAKERLDRIRSTTDASEIPGGTNFPADSIIHKLRAEFMQLAAKQTEIGPRVAAGHNALLKIQERMEVLRNLIRAEDERLAESDFENAKVRERELSANVERLIAGAKTRSLAQVSMRDLESASESARTLYVSLLQKFQEISAAHAQEIGIQDVRVVTRATPPLHKSSRKSILVLGGSLALGLFLGAGAAVAKEWAAAVFRTPDMVTLVTGIHSVVLPLAGTNRKRPGASAANEAGVEEFVLDEPYSRFTESLRTVKTLIDAAKYRDDVKVIGVVSSLPNEGKTTIAANLGALMIAASAAEKRVLVIDGDFHLRRLTAKLAPDATAGVIEALSEPSRLAEFVTTRQRSRLDVLPCVLPARLPNAAELVGSPQMEQLVLEARKTYDFILIEVPPIMSVVDLKMMERFIDRFVFVVEWGQTKRRVVQETLSEAHTIRDRILSIILNKADPSALRSMESYKGARFHDYYKT